MAPDVSEGDPQVTRERIGKPVTDVDSDVCTAPSPRRLDEPSDQTAHSGIRLRRMRWVDHWLGLPLCFLIGLAVKTLRRLGVTRSRAISERGVLAIFKFLGLGSIIQATPLMRALRTRYPEARIAVVTFEANERLLQRLGVCDDLRVIRVHTPLAFVWDVLRVTLWLRQQRVQAVVDLEFFSKFSTLLAFCSGARVRVGFHLNDFWRCSLVTHPIYFNYYRHIGDVYRQAAKRMGADIEDWTLSRIDTGAEAQRSVERFLCQCGWSPGGRLVGVNINSGEMCTERRWPVEYFARLIESLTSTHDDLGILLTGAPSEHSHVASLVNLLDAPTRARVINSAGKWSLDEFVAALSLLSVFVTNDSGPMHLAAAQEVPTLSLWGPGRPAFYAPRVASCRTVYADYPCSPCLYMFTTFEGMWCGGDAWCMRAIKVQTVLEAVNTMLSQSAAHRSPPGELGAE